MKKNIFTLLIVFIAQSSIAQTMHTLWVRSSPSNSLFRYFVSNPSFASGGYGGPSMIIADWTGGGVLYNWRTALSFDLSELPANAIIDSAFLSLWANPTSPSGNVGNPTWGTDNAVGIYRIVDAWDTNTVAWDNLPGFAYTNGDTLAQSTSTIENYLNTNVTTMVKDMFLYEGKYGFMMKHIQETTPLNSMIFYSPYEYSTDTSVTPLLVVKYTLNTTGISDINNNVFSADMYPNPATTSVTINVKKEVGAQVTVNIVDCLGRTVATKNINGNSTKVNAAIDLGGFAKGIYLVKLSSSDGNNLTKKLIVN